jgi:hypothetical protein
VRKVLGRLLLACLATLAIFVCWSEEREMMRMERYETKGKKK